MQKNKKKNAKKKKEMVVYCGNYYAIKSKVWVCGGVGVGVYWCVLVCVCVWKGLGHMPIDYEVVCTQEKESSDSGVPGDKIQDRQTDRERESVCVCLFNLN